MRIILRLVYPASLTASSAAAIVSAAACYFHTKLINVWPFLAFMVSAAQPMSIPAAQWTIVLSLSLLGACIGPLWGNKDAHKRCLSFISNIAVRFSSNAALNRFFKTQVQQPKPYSETKIWRQTMYGRISVLESSILKNRNRLWKRFPNKSFFILVKSLNFEKSKWVKFNSVKFSSSNCTFCHFYPFFDGTVAVWNYPLPRSPTKKKWPPKWNEVSMNRNLSLLFLFILSVKTQLSHPLWFCFGKNSILSSYSGDQRLSKIDIRWRLNSLYLYRTHRNPWPECLWQSPG